MSQYLRLKSIDENVDISAGNTTNIDATLTNMEAQDLIRNTDLQSVVTKVGVSNVNEAQMITELQTIVTNTGGNEPGLGFGLEVRAGLIPNVDPFHLLAFINDLKGNETTISTDMLIDGTGGRTYNASKSDVANTVYVVSSGGDFDDITITGWDANGVDQTETVALNGAVAVLLSNTFSNVNSAHILTGTNIGVITVSTDAAGLNRMVGIGIGENKGSTSLFQVPLNKTLFMTSSNVVPSSTGSSQEITLRVRVIPFSASLTEYVSAQTPLSTGNQYNQMHEGAEGVTARTVCVITVERTGGSIALGCFVSLNGVLVDDAF